LRTSIKNSQHNLVVGDNILIFIGMIFGNEKYFKFGVNIKIYDRAVRSACFAGGR
jgi:hypothetical protein